MPITKLQSDIKKFTHIIHFGDVHIRLNKREQEYKEGFDKFYKEIQSSPEATIVCCCGDLFHNKSDLSAESVQMASDFLRNLANIRTTIIIAGNHDSVLTNKSRLDSISPIVDALNHPNLHYLKKSGLYGIGNILFNNMSVFDKSEDYIKWKDIPTIYKNEYERFIALFHGPVNNALTDLGYVIISKCHPLSIFDGHDVVLCGDIHKSQDLQLYDPEEGLPHVRYAGSIFQQNHGEDLLGHGYSLWDLNKVSYKHVEIPNDYAHFTVDIEKGKLNTDLSNIPKKAHLRIRCLESVATEVKAVLTKIRKVCDISDVVYFRVDSSQDKKNDKNIGSILSGDLSDVEYQNKLISDFLKRKLKITDKDTIESVLKINEYTNSKIKKDGFSRNIRWKPKLFEFDNMFSYGEGNVIDFSKLNDVVGIFGKNAIGKSSIADALSFCIFDKCSKSYKANNILNNQKMGFRCKFNFEINGVDYFIERGGKSDKKGNVPVQVKFWKIENGKEIELHGEGRRDTNEVIRDYLGSYDDFVLTTLSLQNSKDGSFIDMGNSERKDLLSQFIGLTIFDKLYDVSYERNKELSILLREYKNDDFTKKLVELSDALTNSQSLYNEYQSSITKITEEKEKINNQIVEISKHFVQESKKEIDIDNLNLSLKKMCSHIKTKEEEIKKCNEKIKIIQDNIDGIQKEIDELNSKDVEEIYNKFLSVELDAKELKNSADKKKIEIRSMREKIEKLDRYEYDPNCKYCVNNIFVKDAFQTKKILEAEWKTIEEFMKKYKSVLDFKESLKWVCSDYKKLTDLKSKIISEKSKHNQAVLDLSNLEKDLVKLNSEKESVERDIDFYNKHQKDIESNKKIQKEIDSLSTIIRNCDCQYKNLNKNILDVNGKITLFQTQIENIKKKVEKAKKIESEYESYNLYIQCIGRDGISYEVISYTVPEIEKEINGILNQTVDFTIELETDGKNIIPYIVYDKNRWPLELSSGLEKFVSLLAIRVALINISNLPRSSFLVIDEGWGTMDYDNISQVKLLLDYLKNYFEFIVVISHLDSIKDHVSKYLEISKVDGFSHLEYV